MNSILIVDDHKLIRDGLRLYFEDSELVAVADEASNGKQALEIMKDNHYDLVLTDVRMPVMDGVELTRNIRTLYPEQPILTLTMAGESRLIKQLMQLGVNGYLLKDSGNEEVIKAVQMVLEGETYVSDEVTKILIEELSPKKIKTKQRLTVETPLSDREKEVLKLIVAEMTNAEIAQKLFISVRTVDAHKRNLLEKTGAKNVAGLVLFAVEKGLTD